MTNETHETERAELIQTIEDFLRPALHALEPEPVTGARGRPRILPAVALWAGMLVCVVRDFSSQLELWRLLNAKGLWDFPRFGVSDDALYTRLQHLDRDTFKRLFAHVTQLVRQRLPPSRTTWARWRALPRGSTPWTERRWTRCVSICPVCGNGRKR